MNNLTVSKQKLKKSQPPVHHMMKVVYDHNYTSTVGIDGQVQMNASLGTKGKLIQMSPKAGNEAGKGTLNINSEQSRQTKENKESLRKYNASAERDRQLVYTNLIVKDHNYYNKKDSLWNEPQRLDKKYASYSEQNIDPMTTFKKSITDLPMIRQKEKE